MKKLLCLFLCFCCVQLYAQNTPPDKSIHTVSTIDELTGYSGPAEALLLTDARTGGIFYYSKVKQAVDSGIVFPGNNKGYWVRMYDKIGAVNLSWFGAHMDSVTDDGNAMKRALKYQNVKIDGVIALNGKTIFPAGKTITFAYNGAIVVTDTLPLKIEAFVQAKDYQYIFKGTKKVILGTNTAAHLSICWFGAVSDCMGFASGKGTDNTEAINKSIYAAQKLSDVYIPPAPANTSYRITSTITVTKKLHFFSFRLHGGGISITNNSGDRTSSIFADFVEGSAINVQGSRRVYLSDFDLHGRNMGPKLLGVYDKITTTDAVHNPSSFLSPGIKMSYAAITTDAEADNKVWSADIVFERLNIDFFALGIGISQAGNLQGDRMRIDKCQINHCVYGISLGNAQNRACHFTDVDMTRVWCGVTNTAYGNHTGSMFQMTGGQWCHVYKAFAIQPSYVGQCVISGLYTEALGCIGTIGDNNPNNSSVLFTGCNLSMRDEGLNGKGLNLPPFYTLSAYGDVTFQGCNFWSSRHMLTMYAGSATGGYNGSAITMTGCSVLKCTSMHIKGNAIIENTFFNPSSEDINYNRHITIDMEGVHRYNTGYSPELAISGMEQNSADNSLMMHTRTISRMIPRFYTVQDGGSNITNVSLTNDTMVFTYSASLQAPMFRYVVAGDMLGTTIKNNPATTWDNTTMSVVNIDTIARRVTAIAYTNAITFDKIALYTNSFFLTQKLYGTITAGSNIIKQVNYADKLKRGDFITFRQAQRAYRIASVDETTVTLMDDVRENVTGNTELYNEWLTDPAQQAVATTPAIKMVNVNTAITIYDHTIVANATAGDITLVLPQTATAGQIFFIKKTGVEHTVAITAGIATIDGMSTYTLKDNYQGLQVQYDGSNYMIIK